MRRGEENGLAGCRFRQQTADEQQKFLLGPAAGLTHQGGQDGKASVAGGQVQHQGAALDGVSHGGKGTTGRNGRGSGGGRSGGLGLSSSLGSGGLGLGGGLGSSLLLADGLGWREGGGGMTS